MQLKAFVLRIKNLGAAILAAELRLVLEPNGSLKRTAFGMDFLGYRVFPQWLGLARRSKVRFARKSA